VQQLDQSFALLVARMGFTGQHDLKRILLCYSLEALQIGEQQVRALICRHAACESENRVLRLQGNARKRTHLFDERVLRLRMRLDD